MNFKKILMPKTSPPQKSVHMDTRYYEGSFSRMACDYIHATGMTPQEVEELLEAMRQAMTKNK